MPFTNYGLDKYCVQGISNLSECDAPDLREYFDQAEHWIHNFILNTVFRVQIEPKYKPFIFAILRRAQMALVEYQNGRTVLLDYLSGSKEFISVYFRALYHFEAVVTLLYQTYEIIMKLTNKRLFQKNDGSPLERLNRIYNVSKHLEPSTIPEGQLHAVWISNKGLCVSTASISFLELAELVKEIGATADTISQLKLT